MSARTRRTSSPKPLPSPALPALPAFPLYSRSAGKHSRFSRLICSIPFTIALFLAVMILLRWRQGEENQMPLSEDEEALKSVNLEDMRSGEPVATEILGCMPSVKRAGGRVEYVGNAVKSWGLATDYGRWVGRLIVFDMEVGGGFVKDVLGGSKGDWWEVKERIGELKEPRMLTHGDSMERARWRSKEAMDYAEVLERCTEMAEEVGTERILAVQDDVLFRKGFEKVGEWVNRMSAKVNGKWCSLSLFDVGATEDGQILDTSNMVGKVMDVRRARSLARYIRAKFDQSPVDWLQDQYCKNRNLKTYVTFPNLVRHRGKVSSFAGNDREALLT